MFLRLRACVAKFMNKKIVLSNRLILHIFLAMAEKASLQMCEWKINLHTFHNINAFYEHLHNKHSMYLCCPVDIVFKSPYGSSLQALFYVCDDQV